MKSQGECFNNVSIVVESLNLSSQNEEHEISWNSTVGEVNDKTLTILMGVICVTVTSVGLPISILIVTAIATFPELRTNQNAFVASLAVRDMMLIGLFLPAFYVVFMLGFYPFGHTACVIHMMVAFSISVGSVMELMNIAISRYVKICCRIGTYRSVYNKRNTTIFIFLTWSLSFLSGVSTSIVHANLNNKTQVCYIAKSGPKALIVSIILGTAVAVTSFCYFNIWRTVQAARENLKRFNEGPRRHRTVQHNFHTFMRDCVVFIVYLFLLMPFVLLNSFGLSSPRLLAWEIAKLLSYINNFTNCILYGLLNRQIRSRFSRLLMCSKQRQRTNVISPYTISVTGMSRTRLSFGLGKGNSRTPYIVVPGIGVNNGNNINNNTTI